jgi:outer membrane lipoprotein carrier protein
MKRRLLALVACLFTMLAAHADGLQDLERFLREVGAGHADFTQVVTTPAREADGAGRARTRTSSGRFEFLRPGRFRFDYDRPFEQTIVADGQTLWLYDADLNQVTARPQQAALGQTPAALIAADGDLQALRRVFELQAEPMGADGIAWVRAIPRAPDGTVQQVRVGFRDGQLVRLEIVDSLGQTSVLTFTGWRLGGVAAERFRYTPPAGADVIRPGS